MRTRMPRCTACATRTGQLPALCDAAALSNAGHNTVERCLRPFPIRLLHNVHTAGTDMLTPTICIVRHPPVCHYVLPADRLWLPDVLSP